MLFLALIFVPAAKLRVGSLVGPRSPRPATLTSSVAWGAILIVVVAVVSGWLNPADLSSLARGMALATVLLSLVLLTGYAGLTSLCQMTFVGLGAYAMGRWFADGSPWGLLLAFAVPAVVGLVIGALTVRLRGLYLALATFAFAVAMQEVFFTRRLTSGGSLDVPRPHFPGVPRSDRAYFIELTIVFVLAGIAVLAVRRGRYGRRLAAMDDSPAACVTLGLNVTWTKLVVFTVAAGIAGVGGALYGAVPGSVSDNDFIALLSLVILLQLRVGGVNTITGAFLGAMFFAFFGVFTNHDVTVSVLGQDVHVGDLQYLLTGLAAIGVSRDPAGVGGHIARAAEALRERFVERRLRPRTGVHPSETSAPEQELARV
jgi:branched-chain amino acid transport system permease protein